MRVTIGMKLAFGVGLIVVLVAVGSVVVYDAMSRAQRAASDTAEKAFPTDVACKELRAALNNSLSALRGYMSLGGDLDEVAAFKGERTRAWTQIDDAMSQLATLSKEWVRAEDRQDLMAIRQAAAAFRAAQDRIEQVAQRSDNNRGYHIMTTDASPKAQRMLDIVTAMISEEVRHADRESRNGLLAALMDTRASLNSAMSSMRAFLLSGDESFTERFDESWRQNGDTLTLVAEQTPLLTAEQKRNWDVFVQLRKEMDGVTAAMLQARRADDWNRAAHLLKTEAMPQRQIIRDAVERLNSSAEQQVSDQRASLAEAARVASITLVVSMLLVLLVGAGVAFVMGRSIVMSAQRLAERARAIAAGDLRGDDVRIQGSDEIADLAGTFNSMAANLKDLSGQIHSVTRNINSSASEILASTQQQAAAMKEQAASLSQISTTMEEINQSGEQVSDSAKRVAAAAEEASTSSVAGVKAVKDTNATMEAIREQVEEVAENIVALSEKTQAVGEIIATVGDIAEQSNLLALNAGIEAASADVRGGRFGVVAAEMKNLADQAKRCTVQVRSILGEIQKGINTSVMLTEEAVKRVEMGKHQADVTERTIDQMSQATQESVQTFQQIIGATSQQQIGLNQVNQGMQDIRQAAEQTAIGTSQLEKAAASLDALSQQLQTAVGRYRL